MRLCPWADVVYGCDGPWWKKSNGLPEFKGIKLAHDTRVCTLYRDLHKVEIEKKNDEILVELPGVVGDGGNSGFQALNLAVQFGAAPIILIGFDMLPSGSMHWYGRNTWRNANNPTTNSFMRWRNVFHDNLPLLRRMGIEVVNASPDSALVGFKRGGIEETLARWGV